MASPFATPTERLASFFDPTQPRQTYDDAEIHEITNLLHQCAHPGCRSPRTYIILRTIGQLDLLERCLQEGFNDIWFPVEAKGLPNFIKPSIKTKFVQTQQLILTKSLDLEHGEHRHFAPGELLPFDIVSRLGSGSFGQVDKIMSKVSFRPYALKRIRRRAAFGNDSRQALARIKSEISIIKSLEHDHIIQYVGSYTDKTFLGIVMTPVADTDLASFMNNTARHVEAAWARSGRPPGAFLNDPSPAVGMSSSLRSYFGCLAAALVYLHDRSIRHKDIKPQNILIHNGTVILTDFGLSHDFADDVGSTTSGPTPASPRYSAPEVAAHEARNTSADIWSLGCVFFEMAAALRGFNIDWVKSYFTSFYSMSPYFHANLGSLNHLLQEWYGFGPAKDTKPLLWIRSMLQADRMLRPTAAEVLDFITAANNPEETATSFCGICCLPCYESDSYDSLADEPPDYNTSARPSISESQFQHERLEAHIHHQEHRQVRSSTFLAPQTSGPNFSSYPTPQQNPQHLTDRTVVHHTLRPRNELVSGGMAHHQGPPPPYVKTGASFTARDMQGIETRVGNDFLTRLMAQPQTHQLPERQTQQHTIQPNNFQAGHIDSRPAPLVVSSRPHEDSKADRDELSKGPDRTTLHDTGGAFTIKEAEKGEKKGDEKSKQDMEAKLNELKRFASNFNLDDNPPKGAVPEKTRLPSAVENEKEKDAEKLKQDRKVKLNELQRFASKFQLHTPVPTDLVPILANNEDKQRELVIKALEAARKSRGKEI